MFRKTIQETIRQGKIKFAEDKGKALIEVDIDPFPKKISMFNIRETTDDDNKQLCTRRH